jgi:hypothetical protein
MNNINFCEGGGLDWGVFFHILLSIICSFLPLIVILVIIGISCWILEHIFYDGIHSRWEGGRLK